jgi:hypothetical protein
MTVKTRENSHPFFTLQLTTTSTLLAKTRENFNEKWEGEGALSVECGADGFGEFHGIVGFLQEVGALS